jgi:hypothetical protein
MRSLFAVVVVLAACTKENPDYCDSDSDCTDAAKPFCDVKGEYAESQHTSHTCTPTPVGCPIERCGCEPGEGLSCADEQLTFCAADGRSTATTTCPLGCASSEARCLGFDPSNGLASALMQATNESDVILPAGTTIDTELGLVQDTSGATLPVATVVVNQPGGPAIRALLGKSFVVDGVKVTGSYALALVAPGSITIRGTFDASADGTNAGPAGRSSGACVGASVQTISCIPMGLGCNDGAGGGGNVTMGGAGGGGIGGTTGTAGAAVTGASALSGGCAGGGVTGLGGGGGGGAVQLSSQTAIAFTGSGVLNVGGGGGATSAGGGSGGNVVLEAPVISFGGQTTGVTANGGAGGGCGMTGEDGKASVVSASGPQCGVQSAGFGGTASNQATSGATCTTSCPLPYNYGGGGGAHGTLAIATRTGEYSSAGSPIVSAAVTKRSLAPR